MFGKVAAFEFRQTVRSPLFWAVSGLFFLLTFGYMASDHIQIGDTANVHKNSPFAILQVDLIMGVFFMFASTAFVASSVIRDDETGFGPILHAAPHSKFDYLYGGRFATGSSSPPLCWPTPSSLPGSLPARRFQGWIPTSSARSGPTPTPSATC